MTKSEFKKAMMRGLGRCVIELDENDNIEQYRDIVLWGCLHNLSYDTQSEGTRSEYMYSLQNKFNDDYFEFKIIGMFMKEKMDSWLFDHFANLLYLFAKDGSEKSYQSLYNKYGDMLNSLTVNKRYLKSSELKEQFEWLCIWIVTLDGISAFIKIVSDIGGAYNKNSNLMEACTFEWFYEASKNNCGGKRITKYMEKSISKSEDVRLFYKPIKDLNEKIFDRIPEIISVKEVVKACKEEWFKCRGMVVRFSRNASDEELLELARIAFNEPQEEIKANMIWAFRKRRFPLQIEIIIGYTKSDNEKLVQNAFEILTRTKDKIVREFAMELIKEKKHIEDALSILFKNYKKEDTDLIFSMLKRIKVNYSEGIWHGVYSDAISWMEHDRKVPEKIILFLYENILCSYCREHIVRVMSNRGILKDTLLKECLYDSNSNIRKFAERKYKRIIRTMSFPI
jgi:hypothetical protein